MQRQIDFDTPRFNGSDYDPARDNARLGAQFLRVLAAMSDHDWHTLDELHAITGDPQASISAQIRHARKARFGSHTIEKQHRGNGLFAYRLPPTDAA
jgi:hypothetical protein